MHLFPAFRSATDAPNLARPPKHENRRCFCERIITNHGHTLAIFATFIRHPASPILDGRRGHGGSIWDDTPGQQRFALRTSFRRLKGLAKGEDGLAPWPEETQRASVELLFARCSSSRSSVGFSICASMRGWPASLYMGGVFVSFACTILVVGTDHSVALHNRF